MAEICETCGLPEAAHEMDPCARAALQARATPDAEIARLRAEVTRLTRERDEGRMSYETASEQVNAAVDDAMALRACVTQLVGALRTLLTMPLFPQGEEAIAASVQNRADARAALTAAEKLGT